MNAREPHRERSGHLEPSEPAEPFEHSGPFEPDPVIEVYKKDIDRSLLRENLRRSVAERMDNLVALQRFAQELRAAGRRHTPS